MKLNSIAYVTLITMLVGTLSTFAMEQKETALSFDLDNVVSSKEKVGLTEYMGLSKAFFWNPKILTAFLPGNFEQLKKDAHEIGKSVNGSSNVIHKHLERLKEQGYGDLSAYEETIVERSVKPKPIYSIIHSIHALKKQGYTVVGATNQDYKQHAAYRRKMKEGHAIDINELFHAVVTTRVHHENAPESPFYRLNQEENIYVAENPTACKPHIQYFEVVKGVIKKIAPQVTTIIHTDDLEENCTGASQAHLESIHFKLAGGSAQKTSQEDIENTVNTWKAALAEYKINL